MKTLIWQGCYDDSWKGVIPAAAFEHPAKFSKRLVERILDHMEERGWLDREQQPVIADPFGGVRTGGVICAYRGYRWLGVELEQRFMDLGDQVFAVHRGRWDRLGVPQPVCVRGDSRRFDEILKEASAVISSPPYISGGHHTDVFDAWNKNGGGQNSQPAGYGKTEGQISRARKGKVDVVISSPPYEDSLRAKEHGFDFAKAKPDYPGRVEHAERVAQHDKAHGNRRYGDEPGQIGKLKKQTYWEAMAEVYSATFRALKAGGVMAIVVKDFVKAGKRQRLCDDTLKLLKHIGFLPLERVRAMLIEDWVAPDLFEGTTTKRKTRKSFFRRHLESKLAADDPRRIDWEEVLFVRKPV